MKLIYYPHQSLSTPNIFEVVIFSDPEFQLLIDDMIRMMCDYEGIGLAANQVDKNHRLFVAELGGDIQAFINPKIVNFSDEKILSTEACLSIPGVIAKLRCRSKYIETEYYDRTGELQTRKFTGREAAIFQHEFDHLNGITILDRMSSLQRQIQLKKYQKGRK